jgi:hypothetical protein
MGYAAAHWFEKGEKLSSETLKKLTGAMTTYLLESLKGMGKHKPGSKSLQQHIEESLEESSLAESSSDLDDEVKK